ncbi:tol-pal system protein YbgF [Polynucleobacter sp. 30F-ANTBAC]|jgi:tol-pal system protein YbgF|uniref:tol-pal system protein YbgF n=1 Tax=Polynucleobacter sp. 30F-ANTBAC TaxID=2689095 RepID=UPI001C0B9BED|nr:tol-pal system protein YbgF [Polynucleobacter sp. 30F-ANTBAC]MBU3599595.1 tol-pal system protein YbgF [Polynucleobacter sp. 30F-ANTBAC]
MQMKINHYLHKTTAALAAVVFVASASLATPAYAFLEDAEARRAILELRSQLGNSQKSQVQMQGQLDELTEDNAKLKGRADLLEKQVEELLAQQKSFYGDLNNRLKSFEPQVLEIEGVQGKVLPGEKEAYDAALKAFQDGNLKKSDAGFSAFTKKYPSSPYWPLAQFWLGSSEYGQKDYKSAIATLQSLVKRYPLHIRTPDALLTLANSQVESGQKPAGKKTLESLIAKHPESEAAELAKQALKRLK